MDQHGMHGWKLNKRKPFYVLFKWWSGVCARQTFYPDYITEQWATDNDISKELISMVVGAAFIWTKKNSFIGEKERIKQRTTHTQTHTNITLNV